MESDIYGFDKRYTVNNVGEVWAYSKYDKKLMTPTISSRGYFVVGFRRKGKQVSKSVHRLVAMAFVAGYAPGKQVNHKDGNKRHNNALNLEWVTARENSIHSRQMGLYDNRGSKHSMSKLTEKDVREIRAMLDKGIGNYSRIAQWYKVNKTCVRKIATRETWRHI